jgi:hypothetical protein
MNIQIFGFPIGIPFLIGVVLTICFIIAFYFAYRLYKRVGRRCRKKGCGSLNVKRVNKIHFGPNETISLKSEENEWRWWIRRVDKETYSVCLDCEHIELVKTSLDQLSFFHGWWVSKVDKQQYLEDPKLNNIAYQATLDRLNRKHLAKSENSILTDTPPIKIDRNILPLRFLNFWRSFPKKSQKGLI